VLILESVRSAESRGAKPLAELLGWGASCDAHHMTAPHPDGEGAAQAIIAALSDAGLRPDDIAFVNAHGTGTPQNDISECRALHRVFGARASRVPVTANKASLGHQLGCSGAIEAIATVLALMNREIQPTAGSGRIDEAIDLDVVIEQPRSIPPGSIGVTASFAFGGACAAVIIADWAIGARS
jgi:3-oxoacyl-[acyl-carrier-protein] synthase II